MERFFGMQTFRRAGVGRLETLSVSSVAVEPDTVYALSLAVDGIVVKSWAGETAVKDFSFDYSGAAGSGHTVVATVVSQLNGTTYTDTRTLSFTVGGLNIVLTDYSGHSSAATAILVHEGDTIVLPELEWGWSYKVPNERFLALEGLVLTAVEPGIVGVGVYKGTTRMDTIAVVVLPEAPEGGNVYVYDETVSTGDRIWDSADAWKRVGSDTNDSWPCQPGDIAVLPFYDATGTVYLRHKSGFSVGGILFGHFLDVSLKCVLERHSSVGTQTITFERPDDEPAFAKVTANTTTDLNNTLCFGGYAINLEIASPTLFDACSCATNTTLNQGFTTFSSCTVNIPTNSYLAIDGLPGYELNMGGTIGPPTLTGEGMFWKKGMGGITFGSQNGFHGTILDTSHGHLISFNRAAPIFWNGGGGTNVSIAIAGWVYPHLGNPSVSSGGCGWFRTGWDPAHGAEAAHPAVPWNPRKTMTLRGGAYEASSTENDGWGVGVRSSRIYENLVVGSGMSYVSEANDYRSNSSGHPINYIEWGALDHEDKGTLVIWDHSRRSVAATTTSTNAMTVILNHDAHLVGQGKDGDCLSSDVYPIIPWIVAPTTTEDDNWRMTMFASFDSEGRLTRPVWNNTALDAAASPYSNAYLWDQTIEIETDVTLNSLFMNNSGKNKWLGAGRTLTLTSGGLVLYGNNTAIGQSGRTDNGSLVLGDADHPAYVFARSSDASKPNQIWADVTAPGGFVSSFSGALVLGGCQTNILEELVVNAGVLTLGTANAACSLRRNLDVRVCSGAELAVPRTDAIKGTFLRLDGVDGQFGTVTLDADTSCKKCYLRDWPVAPEWETLPRGSYGSSDSAAENIRDDLFAGTGILDVKTDDQKDPTILLVR